jgi:hypothetical protein
VPTYLLCAKFGSDPCLVLLRAYEAVGDGGPLGVWLTPAVESLFGCSFGARAVSKAVVCCARDLRDRK